MYGRDMNGGQDKINTPGTQIFWNRAAARLVSIVTTSSIKGARHAIGCRYRLFQGSISKSGRYINSTVRREGASEIFPSLRTSCQLPL